MTTKLDPSAKVILRNVLAAMQRADEISGPEGLEYLGLMEAISREASDRAYAYASHAFEGVRAEAPTRTFRGRHAPLLSSVLRAMQGAEEMGGPEGVQYLALMEAILTEANQRAFLYTANTLDKPRPGRRVKLTYNPGGATPPKRRRGR